MSRNLKVSLNNINDFILKIVESLEDSKRAADEFNNKDELSSSSYLYKDKESALKAIANPELDRLNRLIRHKISLK